MPRKSASALEVARELHESQRYADAQSSLRPFVHRPASRHEDQRNTCQVDDIAAGLLASYVTGGDVTDLMRHDAGQLGFVVRGQNEARVHVEKSARQREGIEFVGINHLDGERHLGIRVAHQVLAERG